jgi:hypothetical protein
MLAISKTYKRWQEFLVSLIVMCVFPLLPLGIEYYVTGLVSLSSLVITSVMYALTVTLTIRDQLLFLLSYVWTIVGSISYVIVLSEPTRSFPIDLEMSSVAVIGVYAAIHTLQRAYLHLVLGTEFLILK